MNVIDHLAGLRGGGAWDKSKAAFDPEKCETDIDTNCDGYLMCSLDVYVKNEPCLMCAMALVHSRTRRLFFSNPSPNGGFQTLTKMHTIEELNHSFEVFRISQMEEY